MEKTNERKEEVCCKNNVEYIRDWFIKNNAYLANRDDKEEIMNLLVCYAIIFEKLSGIQSGDVIVKEGNTIHISGGPIQKGKQVTHILKYINYELAYIPLEHMKKRAVYIYLYDNPYLEGELTGEIIEGYFGDNFRNFMRLYAHSKFERIVYVIKNKVFYADQVLTDEEIETIRRVESGLQVQYDVDHDDNGEMYWW